MGCMYRKKWAISLKRKATHCVYCKEEFSKKKRKTFEHLIPKSRGGEDRGNIVICCLPCNILKADTYIPLGWLHWIIKTPRLTLAEIL